MSEIGVKLSGDSSEYRSMLGDAAQKGAEFAGNLAEKVGDKLYGLRDVSHVVANALGLNLEKIAERVARVWADLSEEEEKAYAEANRLSDENTALVIKNGRAKASAEVQYALLLKDRAQAEKELADIQATAAARSIDTARINYDTQKGFFMSLDRDIQLTAQEQEKQKRAERVLIETNAEIEKRASEAKLEAIKKESDAKTAAEKKFADFQKTVNEEGVKKEEEWQEYLKLREEQEDKITEKLTQQGLENLKLIAQAKERAEAESRVTSEFDKQLQSIVQMKKSSEKKGFSLSVDNPALTAAERQLANAEAASQDAVANPNYQRDLFKAQMMVQSLRSGGSGEGADNAAYNAAFGVNSKNQNVITSGQSAKLQAVAENTARMANGVTAIAKGLNQTGVISFKGPAGFELSGDGVLVPSPDS